MRALAAHLSHERYACSPVHAASAPLPEAQPHAQAYLHCHTRAQQARLLKLLHSSTSLSVIGILTGYPGSLSATAAGPLCGRRPYKERPLKWDDPTEVGAKRYR